MDIDKEDHVVRLTINLRRDIPVLSAIVFVSFAAYAVFSWRAGRMVGLPSYSALFLSNPALAPETDEAAKSEAASPSLLGRFFAPLTAMMRGFGRHAEPQERSVASYRPDRSGLESQAAFRDFADALKSKGFGPDKLVKPVPDFRANSYSLPAMSGGYPGYASVSQYGEQAYLRQGAPNGAYFANSPRAQAYSRQGAPGGGSFANVPQFASNHSNLKSDRSNRAGRPSAFGGRGSASFGMDAEPAYPPTAEFQPSVPKPSEGVRVPTEFAKDSKEQVLASLDANGIKPKELRDLGISPDDIRSVGGPGGELAGRADAQNPGNGTPQSRDTPIAMKDGTRGDLTRDNSGGLHMRPDPSNSGPYTGPTYDGVVIRNHSTNAGDGWASGGQ